MKKIKNSTDINQKQGQELSKKLYRTISEQAKRLDDARSCARAVCDLFTPNYQIQRKKFCEYCEKLIFSDPVLYGKKGEELLWRKAYYDVVSTAKKLKKNEYTQNDIVNLQTHISSGVGFYHHFITKLQHEFHLNLNSHVDFSITNNSSCSHKDNDDGVYQWAYHSVHQSLIYLGDLNRYKLEISTNSKPLLAYRYYLQAAYYQPDYGMPHNQMGTLAMSQNNFLDAVYHYMRCLSCKHSFDGTINNLHGLFEKNSKYFDELLSKENTDNIETNSINDEHIKRCLSRFLLLIDNWYFNKKIIKVYNLCQQTYKDLEEFINFIKPTVREQSPETSENSSSVDLLSNSSLNNILFKLIVICLLCISKLQKINSPQLSTVVAFTLAIYSLILQNISNHIQESVLNYPLNQDEIATNNNCIVKELFKTNDKKKKKKKKSNLRRRNKIVKNDSDNSDDEDDKCNDNDTSSDSDSFISDIDDVLAAESSSDDDDDDKINNSETEKQTIINNNSKEKNNNNNDKDKEKMDNVFKKVQQMEINDMLEIISEQGSLQSIKIINDWLIYNTDIIKSCGTNTRSLLRQITNLLNLININISNEQLLTIDIKLNINEILINEKIIPLSEDILLKGFDLLIQTQNNFDWNYLIKNNINMKEETIIRIIKLLSFGKFLTTIDETGVDFNENDNIFVCKSIDADEEEDNKLSGSVMEELELQEVVESSPVINNTSKLEEKESESKGGGQLMKMKHMGQLWLAAEVRALENRVKGKASLSPYLVLDADALIKYTFMVKQLVNSRKFIVLIPSAVVSALDDLKREQSEARDAIRWLEAQFHRGNRFFRAQRPQEKCPIPFIKYPKKKDKEMCIYIQIIECCHYLAEQQKGASNLVTLLIGNQNVLTNGENKEFSYVGLAQSAGVAIESITQFYSKWKRSYKEKR